MAIISSVVRSRTLILMKGGVLLPDGPLLMAVGRTALTTPAPETREVPRVPGCWEGSAVLPQEAVVPDVERPGENVGSARATTAAPLDREPGRDGSALFPVLLTPTEA